MGSLLGFDWSGDFFVIQTETEGSRLDCRDLHDVVDPFNGTFDGFANCILLLTEN